MLYLGVMSGTSLDGVDLALCRFNAQNPAKYQILKATTVPYPASWHSALASAYTATGRALTELDRSYGRYVGQLCAAFLADEQIHEPLLICSHGHTVFHAPAERYTLQIGHGPSVKEAAGYPVLSDFRSADVAAGGQGAPLVPIADKDLFSHYGGCLNLGGFANVSFKAGATLRAHDICPCNTLLNEQAGRIGLPYDEGGNLAKKGIAVQSLLTELQQLPIYTDGSPVSLSTETLERHFKPIMSKWAHETPQDLLASLCLHFAWAIARSVELIAPGATILVTGGGAFNSFLLQKIKTQAPHVVWHVPDSNTINFKEALAFAYLGYLYTHKLPGNVPACTGAAGPRILGTLAT